MRKRVNLYIEYYKGDYTILEIYVIQLLFILECKN